MNRKNSKEQKLTKNELRLTTRAKKLGAGAVLLLGAGLSVVGNGDKNPEPNDSRPGVEACGVAIVGDSKTGWTHGAAREAIENAQGKALESLDMPADAAEGLPIYNNANKAVELADKGVVPDVGDKIKVCVEVDADGDGDGSTDGDAGISVEVKSAEIIDLKNNQD
ncbi:hypothetical protein H6796_00690 [Candidatus Nomurabacteria bacterium]|nr:hypothetical protein [Candidatus Nomurabacteria bacterium]